MTLYHDSLFRHGHVPVDERYAPTIEDKVGVLVLFFKITWSDAFKIYLVGG